MITWFDFLSDSAFVFLKREAMDGECLYDNEVHVKYLLSGQQLVTIDFPAIDVHANKDYVPQGGTVRFTATPIDFTLGASGTWNWFWQAAGTGTPIPS
jgi:hypothetical protein